MSAVLAQQEISVLLVDDDQVDIHTLIRSIQTAGVPAQIHVAKEGREALDKLRGEGGRGSVPKPTIVLLDLNMPQMGGIEFLKQLRNDPTLSKTVVFVLSDSKSEESIQAAYSYNIAGYIEKPTTSWESLDAMLMLQRYCRMVALP